MPAPCCSRAWGKKCDEAKEKRSFVLCCDRRKTLNWELKQMCSNQRFSRGKILIQAPQQNHHLSRATAQLSEPPISSPKWAAGNRQHRSFGRSWIRSCAHVLPAPPMKVSVILRLQKKSWFLTILNLQDFTASSTPHAGAKDRNSERREGAAGGSLGRNGATTCNS